MRHRGLMAAVNVRISSHCLHFKTVRSLSFWGCHRCKIKPNPAMMINIAKWMCTGSPRGSIEPTSGELALCANYPSSIFYCVARCPRDGNLVFIFCSALLPLGSQGQPNDWGGIAPGEPQGQTEIFIRGISQVSSLICSLKNNATTCSGWDAVLSQSQRSQSHC